MVNNTSLSPTRDEFADDILQPLPLARFNEYREACKSNFPHAMSGHHYLIVQEHWNQFLSDPTNSDVSKQISSRCKHRVYAHRDGVSQNCTIIGITNEDLEEDDYTIMFIFTLEENHHELNECIRQTKRIKWDFGPLFVSVHNDDLKVLNQFTTKNGMELDDRTDWPKPSVCIWLPKEKALAMEYVIPDNIYVARLTVDHAELVNNEWPHGTAESLDFVKSIIMLNDDGIGLFDKESHQLLSWVMATEVFAAGFLQTVEAAKGQGLGTLIMKIYCKEFARRFGMDVLAYIMISNTISRKLFSKLGFEAYRECAWTKLKPIESK